MQRDGGGGHAARERLRTMQGSRGREGTGERVWRARVGEEAEGGAGRKPIGGARGGESTRSG